MFKNFLKTTLRNWWKHKTYTFLNIAGLAIGITCAALIFLWVEDEVGYNHSFANHDYIYRVMQNETNNGQISTNGSSPGPMATAIKKDVPGVQNTGRLSWAMDELVVFGDKSIKQNGIYADPSILQMLPLPLVQGNTVTALSQLQSVIVSESFAKAVFGDANPMGKTVKMNANQGYSVDGLYTITGVFKDLPKNSYYHFTWMSPYLAWETANPWLAPWNNDLTETLVQLQPSTDPATVDNRLYDYLSTKTAANKNHCWIFAMNDWNLRNHFEDGKIAGGNIKYVHLFSVIAIIILLIACINFMNLATARSEKRAKEVGVLKVMGAGKNKLIGKFIGESLLMSFVAVLLSVGFLYLLVPAFSKLVKEDLSVNITNPIHFLSLSGIVIVCGLTAGSYPAIYLSSFNPARVLKGMMLKSSAGVIFIRKGLVITQFTISVTLIVCTVIIYQQVQHIKNRDIGYKKANLITMDLQGNMKQHFDLVKHQLQQTGLVENATMSMHTNLQIYSYNSNYNWQGEDPNNKLTIHSNVVTPEYLSTMGLPVVAGRDFRPVINEDTGKIIINQSLAAIMGDAGKVGGIMYVNNYKLQIIGIVKDFVYNDMYGPPSPLILYCYSGGPTVMTVRYKKDVDMKESLAKTEALLKVENPGYPFEYHFVDDDYGVYFATETLISKLAALFAMLAISISCLGLFGLAAYTAERRTKEIGIRKVLGASVSGLAGLLSKEFVQLVTVSCLIAFPLAWWAMHNWLQGYEYRTTIHWWVFAIAGAASLAIALITVSFQAIKAALMNPTRSLRSE